MVDKLTGINGTPVRDHLEQIERNEVALRPKNNGPESLVAAMKSPTDPRSDSEQLHHSSRDDTVSEISAGPRVSNRRKRKATLDLCDEPTVTEISADESVDSNSDVSSELSVRKGQKVFKTRLGQPVLTICLGTNAEHFSYQLFWIPRIDEHT